MYVVFELNSKSHTRELFETRLHIGLWIYVTKSFMTKVMGQTNSKQTFRETITTNVSRVLNFPSHGQLFVIFYYDKVNSFLICQQLDQLITFNNVACLENSLKIRL